MEKKIVRFSEGRDTDWEEICQKAVDLGYCVSVAIPTCVVIDQERNLVYATNREEPNMSIDDLREDLGCTIPVLEGLPDIEGEFDYVTEGYATLIDEGDLNVATNKDAVVTKYIEESVLKIEMS